MRIEHLLPAMDRAGMETVAARLTRALARRGHEVGITCIQHRGDLGEELAREGFRVSVVPLPGIRTIFFPTRLVAWLRDIAPDVVHTHTGAWLKSARAAHIAGVPRIVHTVHGLLDIEPWHGPPRKRWAARYTGAIAAVSGSLYRYMREEVGIPEPQLHYLPNGIDTNAFRPGSRSGRIRSRFDLGPDRIVIGHVARLAPVKNQRLLVDAFARVHARLPQAFLALIGEGALKAELEAQVRTLQIHEHVGFFGTSDDLPPIYRDFDVFALSSHSEGTSMSILEAMASGVPVVATAVGGTPELLGQGKYGALVPPNDADALAHAILALATNPEDASRLAANARLHVQAVYDEELTVNRYLELYQGKPLRRALGIQLQNVPCAE